jgi:simple sugar transport system permease protein
VGNERQIPEWFRSFADIRAYLTNPWDPVRTSVITDLIAVVLIAGVILRYTTLGRGFMLWVEALPLGGPDECLSDLFVYGFMGLMAGIGGVVQLLLVQALQPNAIVGKELDVIAAVVLGGASLTGGTGTLLGTLLGVALIAILGNGLTIMRVPAVWYNVFIGLVILISVASSAQRNRRKQKRAILVEAE